ncbi:MAG TPA: tRNA (adenosine(37)-N6)-threonylcarbamoyltransferase complex ATPase subunit type 1 TsaE [Stenotrophobium sp.]|nr:tRNA (adenosine(37)-N6)-threonylcarbamoyltransferase complex ATPase subunit type 1 TsaE [Stenotrophobium sp.]
MKLFLKDADATAAAGSALALALEARRGAVIYLRGELGAGKTTLARGFLRALGVAGAIRSPTYTLMEIYNVRLRDVLHMDCYRLADPLELQNLGLADYPSEQTLWLVEWPEKGVGVLPMADIVIGIERTENGRNLLLSGLSEGEAKAFQAHLAHGLCT